MARSEDTPSPLDAGRIELDLTSNFFIKDPNIPGSYVVVEKTAQDKSSYVPIEIGTQHKDRTDYYLYEESVTDLGNGIFEITSKYAIVPPTWYSFEAINIPFTKFAGTTITGSGGIVITQTFKYGWLNLQGIQDVRFFNEDGFAYNETKSGSINCVVRVKHEYSFASIEEIKSGDLVPFEIQTASYIGNEENGEIGSIDDDLTFNFSASKPSEPIKYEAGKYVGNIYYQKKFEIVSNITL